MPVMNKLSPGERLVEELRQQSDSLIAYIVSGQCEDYVTYARCVARLEAMNQVRQQLAQMLNEDDEA